MVWLDAYNAGRVEAALVLMADNAGISDCDYRAVHVITADGKEALRQWLVDRAADHDQLIVDHIFNENPDPASGSHVIGVVYARRTSDTLRALGFGSGIDPRSATKVVFTSTDDRIRSFANGPFGGDQQLCRPEG